MSQVVVGVAASHATMYNTFFDRTKDQESALRYRAGLTEGHALVQAAKPDAIVVVGSNHFRGFFLDLMPSFTICLGEVWGEGESGTPGGEMPIDFDLGRELAWGLQERSFDVALSLRQRIDHGVTQMLQFFTPEIDIPMVPIVVNSFTPPMSTLPRCYALGQAIREIIENDGQDRRVAVFASGGLSHALPFIPKWHDELSEDRQKLVDALYQGASQEEYDRRRIEIMMAAEPQVNEAWDHAILDDMEAGNIDRILSMTEADIEAGGGNGGQEIRSWIVALGMTQGTNRTLSYSPMHEWHTGMAVAAMLPEPVAAAAA